jgi:hypothetical protein
MLEHDALGHITRVKYFDLVADPEEQNPIRVSPGSEVAKLVTKLTKQFKDLRELNAGTMQNAERTPEEIEMIENLGYAE